MKNLFKLLFALLLVMGGVSQAFAINIPGTENPKDGPAIWMTPVYNNSGSTLSAGDVVVWDIGSSAGDNDNYVTTTTTADTNLVAGVVYPAAISSGDTGYIATHGVVAVNIASGGNSVGGVVCSSSTAAKAHNCGTDANNFGIVTTAVSSGSANVYLKNLN